MYQEIVPMKLSEPTSYSFSKRQHIYMHMQNKRWYIRKPKVTQNLSVT